MAVGAYILIQTDLGHAAPVAAELGGLSAVASADTIAGPYDVIARVDVAFGPATPGTHSGRWFVVSGPSPAEQTCPVAAVGAVTVKSNTSRVSSGRSGGGACGSGLGRGASQRGGLRAVSRRVEAVPARLARTAM